MMRTLAPPAVRRPPNGRRPAVDRPSIKPEGSAVEAAGGSVSPGGGNTGPAHAPSPRTTRVPRERP
jgi:hypothetical protein